MYVLEYSFIDSDINSNNIILSKQIIHKSKNTKLEYAIQCLESVPTFNTVCTVRHNNNDTFSRLQGANQTDMRVMKDNQVVN